MNKKTSVNYIYSDFWLPTASRLQGLTVMQQCVYQMTFRNVYEFKKWLVKSGLVWSRTINTAVNECGKCLHACVHKMRPYFRQFCCRQLKKENSWVKCQLKCQES